MFVHPEEDYDFVVQLQPAVLPRYFQNVTAAPSILADKHANSQPADCEWSLRPGFDPTEAYLDDLTVGKGRHLVQSRRLIEPSSISMLTQSSFSTTHWAVIGLVAYGIPASPSRCHSVCSTDFRALQYRRFAPRLS